MTSTKRMPVFGWILAAILTPLAASSAHAQMWFCPVYGSGGSYNGPFFSPLPGQPAQAATRNGERQTTAYAAPAGDDSRPNYYSEDYEGPKGPANEPSKVAYIRVRVPANAELWINNDKRAQRGVVREFVTPALDPDNIYVYHVKARWREEGGIEVEKTLRVRTISGTRVTVNFVPPPVEAPRRIVAAATPAVPTSPPVVVRQPVNWTANVAPRSFRAPR